MDTKNLKIQILGIVQNVGFRYAIGQIAGNFDLKGFVKNMPDGSLYIEVEGRESGLQKLLEWCRAGPPLARIKEVRFRFSDELQGYKNFRVN